MKRFIYLIVLGITLCSWNENFGQASVATIEGAQITWDNATFDFGDLKQGDKVEHTFRFTNTGNQPLVITNVEVTCGCTTPKGWPRDPIPPGDKSEIVVAFNSAGKYGRQNKVVKVISNATSTSNQVMFTANVLPPDK